MTEWIVRIIGNACGLAVAAWIFDGIGLTGGSDTDRAVTLVVVALLFGVVNEFVRPVVAFLSLPLYVLTLGLMFFVVNALMLLLTGWVSEQLDLGFYVDGFFTAVFGAVVISLIGSLVSLFLPGSD
ncbi:MAG: phage holin family protein [Nocardioidaceae bacterium]|nr:phage holin family protein [Nocardioidaceae bacterium]